MNLALKGSSRDSFAAMRKVLESTLDGSNASEGSALSRDLFSVMVVFDSSLSLRRALTDPSRSKADKATLAHDLFSGKVGAKSLKIVDELVSAQWSAPRDLADVAEWLAVSAETYAADQNKGLERLEEELFRFSRIVSSNPDLRAFIAPSSRADIESKRAAVQALLAGKALDATIALISQAVSYPRGRNIEAALNEFAQAASDRKNQVIAYVRSASPMTESQLSRLSGSLSKQVGRNVRVNVEIDPTIVGGVAVRFADELIDGTLSSRIAQAGRELAV
mgnify:CR=1 FL=1